MRQHACLLFAVADAIRIAGPANVPSFVGWRIMRDAAR